MTLNFPWFELWIQGSWFVIWMITTSCLGMIYIAKHEKIIKIKIWGWVRYVEKLLNFCFENNFWGRTVCDFYATQNNFFQFWEMALWRATTTKFCPTKFHLHFSALNALNSTGSFPKYLNRFYNQSTLYSTQKHN